jgi:beta-glucanase (GH16 family)
MKIFRSYDPERYRRPARPWRKVATCAAVLSLAAFVTALNPAQGSATTSPTSVTAPGDTVPMPVGDVPGWHQTFADDFPGTTLSSGKWASYGGSLRGDSGAAWSPSQLTVANNELVIRGSDKGGVWTTGGLNTSHSFAQTYGRFLVRFRMSAARGFSYAVMLYPANRSGPPEVTFATGNAGAPTLNATTAWKNSSGVNQSHTQTLSVNTTSWHTLGVDWTPGLLVYTLDGVPWATEMGAAVPSTPMMLAMQTEAWPSRIGSSSSTESDMDVAWVTAYSPTAPATTSTSGSESPASVTSSAPASESSTSSAPANTVRMPVGDLPGWHQVLADDFRSGKVNTSTWYEYSGQPGGDPGGWWDPSHLVVENGQLIIRGYMNNGKWTTGGINSSHSLSQVYGQYDIRFRMDQGEGVGYVALLWPTTGSGPPEIDFAEDNGASSRISTYGSFHWSTLSGEHDDSHVLSINMTQWHTLGVEWTPGSIVYTIDGRPWASETGNAVPAIPMSLCIQTQAWGGSYNNAWENPIDVTTPPEVDMHIAWITAYSYVPGSSS